MPIPYPMPHPPAQIQIKQRIPKADFMASNHKLSALLKGRVGQEIQYQTDRVLLIFKDGSKLQVKTMATVPPDSITLPGGAVRAVRQNDEAIMLDFESPAPTVKPDEATPQESPDKPKIEEVPATITLHTAEATACVMLRDAYGNLEYAD